MARLLSVTVTSAISAALLTPAFKLNAAPRNLAVQFTFAYGSGGASVDAWLQTSLDGGLTWLDIANFHGTTASARKAINLNAQTAVTTQVTPTDGSMTANTVQDGLLGPQFRVKYGSSGTYAGSTTLAVDIQSDQIPA